MVAIKTVLPCFISNNRCKKKTYTYMCTIPIQYLMNLLQKLWLLIQYFTEGHRLSLIYISNFMIYHAAASYYSRHIYFRQLKVTDQLGSAKQRKLYITLAYYYPILYSNINVFCLVVLYNYYFMFIINFYSFISQVTLLTN